jgi:hypothetical protein
MAEHHGKGRFSTFVEWLSSVETQRLIALVRMTAIGADLPLLRRPTNAQDCPFCDIRRSTGIERVKPADTRLMLIIWQRLTDSIVPGRRHGPGRFEQFCALQKGDQRHHSVLRSHENETNLCWLGAWLRRASGAPDSGVSGTQRRAAYFLGFSLQPETKAEMTSCPLRL